MCGMFWKWLLELSSHNVDSSSSRMGHGIVLPGETEQWQPMARESSLGGGSEREWVTGLTRVRVPTPGGVWTWC